MKKFFLLIFLINLLEAANLLVTKMKDEKKDIFHLSLSSKTPFICSIKTNVSLQDTIICPIQEKIENKFQKEFKFFSIKVEDDKVLIFPKSNYKILYTDKNFFDINIFKNKSSYTKVDIIFFKKPLSYLKEKKTEGLSFDIDFKESKEFFVDVLNDELVPVVNIEDAAKVDFIKKLFLKGDYYSVIKKADRELRNKNAYASEILLYKIRALDKILENKNEKEYFYTDLINECDNFISDYPSNEHLTEVYYYKIKGLLNTGRKSKAFKEIENLKTNFPDDRFTQKALILKAKKLFFTKQRDISLKILKDILYGTKYVDNALESAYLLTKYYLYMKKPSKASEYLAKILGFDKKYLLKNKKDSYNLAKDFADQGSYKEAVEILKVLYDENNEEMVKNYAYWLDEAGFKEEAYKNYKKYLKLYPNGRFVEFVKERMDKVLLDIKESNSSKKLKDIDYVMKKYSNEPIYKKALIKKVKLLLKEKKYDEVLKLEDKLKDINQTKYLDQAASELFKLNIKKDCIKVVDLVSKYKVKVKKELLYPLATCYFNLGKYKDAFELSKSYLENFHDANEVPKWYYMAIKSATKLKRYQKAIELFEELKKIVPEEKIDKEIYLYLFRSYMGINDLKRALFALEVLEKDNPKNPKLLDLYYELLKYYKKQKMDLMVVTYAKKLLNLQKELNVYLYSPGVDITLIKALKNLKQYNKALKVFADTYLMKDLDDSQKGQLLFFAGEISLEAKKLKQAQEFFVKCALDVKEPMWQQLCSESLSLLEEKLEP